jgi:hypothetical protein
MSEGVEKSIFYFEKAGPVNTDKTLEIALASAAKADIKNIAVASSTGDTAMKLHQKGGDAVNIIAVTYNAGSRFQAQVKQFNENHESLLNKGIQVVRGLHAFSGVEKGFSEHYKTNLLPLNVVADTLRMFSQGVKVCVEIAIMAAEHGFVSPEEEIVAVGGSGHGADTALIMKPVFGADLFKAKIKALLCMPG